MSEDHINTFSVYLLRHPETENNVLDNGRPDVFTEKGQEQLKVIAGYFKMIRGQILPASSNDDVAFVTSSLERSINTAREIAMALDIKLRDYQYLGQPNFYSYDGLDEQPVIGLSTPEQCREAKSCGPVGSINDIGMIAKDAFFYVAREHKPGVAIISPLHGQVNQAILHYLARQNPKPRQFKMGNCDMYHLLYHGNGWTVSQLISYETIKSAITKPRRKKTSAASSYRKGS